MNKPDYCRCGARLGRRGKCPALCEPVPLPQPAYIGPLVVGRTHIGRLAQPIVLHPAIYNDAESRGVDMACYIKSEPLSAK